MTSKIQFLKAIHNSFACWHPNTVVVYDVKDTIFESNSQRIRELYLNRSSCLWRQRYNFWKQFTTQDADTGMRAGLFMTSKIQFLKAIHNGERPNHWLGNVVYDVKDTIFESNSQLNISPPRWRVCCLWRQRYNFWKQFTTDLGCFDVFGLLFMTSKIQFLKAIHNMCLHWLQYDLVVYDVKDTIFESNSQQKVSYG